MDRRVATFNVDNIARTKAYEQFGRKHPEIRWARLAGMVSRNAGWNLTDLTIEPFRSLLSRSTRQNIAWIYERANWLIFRDAYPQLLMYEAYKRTGKWQVLSLQEHGVSIFMIREWNRFLEEKDEWRLLIALIINEQMMVEERLFQRSKVEAFFQSALYKMESYLHFSHVLFPQLPCTVNTMYGECVKNFANPIKRIELGKRLAHLLYHPTLQYSFHQFMDEVEPTGSRGDYGITRKSLPLRVVYPRCSHANVVQTDWYESQQPEKVERLFTPLEVCKPKKVNVYVAQMELAWLNWLTKDK